MKRFIMPLAILLVLAFVIAGCGGDPTPTTTAPAQTTTVAPATTTAAPATTTKPATTTTAAPVTTTAAPTSPAVKSGGVFKFVDPRAPSTTLGWFAEPGAQGGMWSPPMLETLLDCDVNGKFYPMLATEWKVSDDLKTITLKLRQGVKFHDGSDFNATVVKWNLDELINAKVSVNVTSIASVDIVDDYTVRLNLTRYQNSILNTLAASFMTSKAAFDKGGKDGVRWNPVGTGPFKFVSFERDVAIKYTKFNDYWQKGKPYLDGIEMHFVADPVTMSAAFEAGEFYAMGGDLSSVHYDLQQKGNPVEKAYAGAYTLIPDSKNADSPWSNIKVREALDYAIDRDALVKARGFGFNTTIYQFANPGSPAYIKDLQGRKYDPAKAKALLAEAGYPNGFQTKIYADVASSDKDAVTAIQAYMLAVGIQAELQMLDFASYGNYRTKGWNNAVLAGMVGFDANLNNSMDRYWVKSSALFPSVEKTDELQNMHLASVASKDFDPALVQKIIKHLHDNALCSPLWAGSRGDVIKSFVKGTGFYTKQTWTGWEPYNTWLDK